MWQVFGSIAYCWKRGKVELFPRQVTAEFPCDLDTTSLGLTVVRARVNVAASIMDEMLNYINEDGIIQVLVLELEPTSAAHRLLLDIL